MRRIFLNDCWQLREEPLSVTKEAIGAVLDKKEGWLNCSLPVMFP